MDFQCGTCQLAFVLRDPTARLVSGFHHGMHDCGHKCAANASLPEYAMAVAGMYVHYFGGGELERALTRLRQFAFVGLVEYWDLSVCLYHSVFGGPSPVTAELENVRPGDYKAAAKTASPADEAAQLRKSLSDWLARAKLYQDSERVSVTKRLVGDSEVYAAGESIFWRDVRSAKVGSARISRETDAG